MLLLRMFFGIVKEWAMLMLYAEMSDWTLRTAMACVIVKCDSQNDFHRSARVSSTDPSLGAPASPLDGFIEAFLESITETFTVTAPFNPSS